MKIEDGSWVSSSSDGADAGVGSGQYSASETLQALRLKLTPYGKPDLRKSMGQVLNTLVPYTTLWILMIFLLRWTDLSWEIVPLALLAALLMVRVFVLFHVQHQFEGVYWSRHVDWDPMQAALAGSSFYSLPKILQWFTASIGFHHVHHVLPRIPNYNLQAAYEATPILRTVRALTPASSLRSLRLNLWDEQQGRLVSFREVALPFQPRWDRRSCSQ
jgi:omega-6 fatty acid desaturase (delta-12 desaturase)